MSQFPFIVESEEGVRYRLVKRGNFCELDFVEQSAQPSVVDTPARATEMEVEEVTLEARAERIRRLQADVQRGIIEIGFELIAAKKEVGHGNWANWLDREFTWTVRTAQYFMKVAERFGKTNTCSHLNTSTLKVMLALPEGDEQAFIEAQQQAGNPVENPSARQVQQAVKQWKKEKTQKSSPLVSDQINLFPEIAEARSESVGENQSDKVVEYEPPSDFDSSDSELTSTPVEESDESIDENAPDELGQNQNDKNIILQEEAFTVNDSKENSDDDLIAMRDEMQKLLAEITELMKSATKTELADTIQSLKSIRDALNLSD